MRAGMVGLAGLYWPIALGRALHEHPGVQFLGAATLGVDDGAIHELLGVTPAEYAGLLITCELTLGASGAGPPRPRHPLANLEGSLGRWEARRRSAGTARTHGKPSLRSGPLRGPCSSCGVARPHGSGDAAAPGHAGCAGTS